MALTTNNIEMIKAIAKNDLRTARKAAIASCVEDTSKKNEWFTNKYESLLLQNNQRALEEIPANLHNKLLGQAPEDFREDRYYLSDREKIVFEKIYKMKVVADQMQDLNIPYHNTTLLTGVSGTGKTKFAEYVAHRLGLPFFYMNFSQMIDSYMGGTAGNINRAFEFVFSTACVFVIDEIDCIATKRDGKGGKGPDGELERTTISLMQELDRLPNNVVLIATTNRPDILDEAFLRRFSIKHEVEIMSEEESLEMVKLFINSIKNKDVCLSEDVVKDVIRKEKTPALIMNEIIIKIGEILYSRIEDKIPNNPWNEDLEIINKENPTYEVIISRKYTVIADNKEDAVRKAEFKNSGYSGIKELGEKSVSVEKLK